MASQRLGASALLVSFACLLFSVAGMAHGANSLTGSLGAATEVSSLGGSTYQLPIQVPPGILGVEPVLSLQYNSQQGEGLAGLGMSLTGLSIVSRCPATDPIDGYIGSVNFNAQDRFCLDGARLIVVKGNYGQDGSEYHTESETWTRIIAHGICGSGPCSFTATNKDGWTLEFGTTADSRPLVPGAGEAIGWQIARSIDLNGNAVRVEYAFATDGLQNLPQRVSYTENAAGGIAQGSREVRFEYEPRPDAMPRYIGGQRFQMSKRLSAIRTRADSTDVLSYRFAYDVSKTASRSLLSSVAVCSERTGECLGPTRFTWQEAARDVQSPNNKANGEVAGNWCKGHDTVSADADFNADGRPDLLCTKGSEAFVLVSTGTEAKSPNNQAQGKLSLPNAWCSGDKIVMGWTDFNGDRKADLVCSTGTSTFKAMVSTGANVVSANTRADGLLTTPPQWCDASRQCQARLANFDGDGRGDLACDCAVGDHRVLLSTGKDVHTPNNDANGTVATGFCSAAGATTSWGDFNGDGQSDLFCHDHGRQSVLVSTGKQLVSPNRDARGFLRDNWCAGADDTLGTADFNGDGLADLACRVSSGAVQVLLSSGQNVASPNNDANGLVKSGWCSGAGSTLDWGDFNGDGLADAFCHENSGRQSLMVSTGTLLESGNSAADGLLRAGWCQNSAIRAGASDFNGDALADLRCADATTGTQSVLVHAPGFPDLLASVTNGLGGGARFSYRPMTDDAIYRDGDPVTYPVLDIRTPLYLVDRYTQFDGRGAEYAFSYQYHGARTQVELRRWLGFQQVKRTTQADGRYSLTHYIQDYPIVGFIDEASEFAGNGALMTRSTFTPTVITPYANVAEVLRASERSSTYTAGKPDYVYEKRYEYDSYGDTRLIQDLGEVGDPADDLFDCWVYRNDAVQWRLGYVQSHRSTRTDAACRAFLQNPAIAWSDATDLRWDRTGYDAKLNPTALDAWDNQNQVWLSQGKRYDGFGNVVAMTDWAGNTTDLTMDASKSYVAEVASPALAGGLRLRTHITYDTGFGNLLSQTDPNGNQRRNEFDGFGRQLREYGPLPGSDSGDATELLGTHRYGQDSAGAYVEIHERTDWSSADPVTWPQSRLYVDGLSRPVRTIRSGPAGGRAVVTEQSYDNLGRLWRNSYPRFDNETASWLVHEYDSFNRLTKLIQPDGVVQNLEYLKGELQVRTTIAPGSEDERSTTTDRSVRDAVIKTVGRNNGAVTYQYDPLVQTRQSVGPRGDVTTFRYDALGRVIGSSSADSGEKRFAYDAKGLLATVEAPDHASIRYEYDAMGRIQRQITAKAGEADQVYVYTYDGEDVRNGLGQLTQVVGPAATQAFAYTPYGQVQVESLSIDGHTYAQTSDYAPTGWRTRLIYPDGAVLDSGYDAVGNPTTLDFRDSEQASPRQIANYRRYSAQNQVVDVAFGNGTNTTFDYYTYAESMARPKAMRVMAGDPATIRYAASYSWNKVGQLAVSNNQRGSNPAENYRFSYDSMGWLKQANGPYGILDYVYDSAGNITRKDGVTYSYANNSNHLTGADNGLKAEHDGAGNVSSLNWPGANWGYRYGGDGNLNDAKLNGTPQSTYLYDFAGNRLKRSDASGAVSLYVSADFDVTVSSGHTLYTRYISGPTGRIAASTVEGSAPAAQAAVDRAGLWMSAQGLRQSAWGARAEAAVGGAGAALLALSDSHPPWRMLLLLALIASPWLGREARRAQQPDEAGGGRIPVWRAAATPWLMLAFLAATWPVPGFAELGAGGGLPKAGELYFHADTLGSSVLTTNARGEESSVLAYLPFGGIDQGRSSGPNDFRPKFSGKELDQPVGLNYFGARYEHPTLGRFLQPDPQNQFANPYSYVGNDPLTLVDPNGEEVVSAVIFVTLVVIGAIGGAYSGASAVNHDMNPAHWDWRKGKTYAGLFAGAAIGAAGGAIGGAAAEAGVAAGIIGEIAVGAVEGASFAALGGGSPTDIVESALTGGIFGGLSAGAGSAVGGLARGGSRMLARGETSLLEEAAGETGAVSRVARQSDNIAAEVGPLESRTLRSAESGSGNNRLLSPSDTQDIVGALETSCFSFAAGTQIATPHGLEDIASIHSGDQVWAMSENGTAGAYTVLALHQRDADDVVEVQVNGKTIVTTREHPFWTQPRGWVQAYQLLPGDRLLDKDGESLKVEEVSASGDATRVYNFEVAEAHTYFAGDSDKQVLVHNGKTCSKRLLAMGRTPGKRSRVGRDVIKRMEKQGYIRLNGKAREVAVAVTLGGPRVWKKLDAKVHMGHIKDAVIYWNKTGYKFGAKSAQVRKFMLDSSNYELEWGPLNSSNGAKLGTQYRRPLGWTGSW